MSFMPGVTIKTVLLSVIMLNVVMLSVVATRERLVLLSNFKKRMTVTKALV